MCRSIPASLATTDHPTVSKGRVIFVSRNWAMLVVQSDEGFSVVEMLGDDVHGY